MVLTWFDCLQDDSMNPVAVWFMKEYKCFFNLFWANLRCEGWTAIVPGE